MHKIIATLHHHVRGWRKRPVAVQSLPTLTAIVGVALRRYLSARQISTWTKEDRTALGVQVPNAGEARLPGFVHTLKRYGSELWAIAKVPWDPDAAAMVEGAPSTYTHSERRWDVLVA